MAIGVWKCWCSIERWGFRAIGSVREMLVGLAVETAPTQTKPAAAGSRANRSCKPIVLSPGWWTLVVSLRFQPPSELD
jgi:hypothetical protein